MNLVCNTSAYLYIDSVQINIEYFCYLLIVFYYFILFFSMSRIIP